MTHDDEPPKADDGDLEARLEASWTSALERAADDLADGALVRRSMDRGTRPRVWPALAALVTVGAIVVVGVALILGGGALRSQPSPSGFAGQPTPAQPTSVESAEPEGSVIPILDPGVSFPPNIDGQPVLAVGSGAEDRLASIADASPVYISGWILDSDRRGGGCNFDNGSPAPNGVFFKPCTAIPIREGPDGGAELGVHWSYLSAFQRWSVPGHTQAMRILLEVHAHDAGCASVDCAQLPVLDRVIAYGTPRIEPAYLAAAGSPPPSGVTIEQAISAAVDYAAKNSTFGATTLVMSVTAGPRPLVGSDAGPDETGWVWDVRLATHDGYEVYDVFVDYASGAATGSRGGSLNLP